MTPLQLVTVCAVLSSSLCKPIGAQAAQPPSVADWGHDVDAIVRDIRTTHPDPFTITGRVTFLRAAQALRQALPSLSEEQRVAAAMRLVASIGDGHTQLEPNGNARFSDWYPIRLYEFTDGFFVTTAHRSVGELAGAEVLNIAGHPAAEVVAAARTLMGADNAFGRLENLYAVHSASLMKGLGYAAADGSLRVTCKLRDGTVVERTLVPRKTNSPGVSPDDANFGTWSSRREMFGPPIDSAAEWVAAFRQLPATAFRVADTTRPPHLMNPRLQMTYALPAWKAYYIQLNFINNTSTETFPGLIQRALREVDELKPRRLIVDLRYNYGGDGSAVRAMIQEFIARQNHQPWNELYVLVGRRTFSAAILALGEFLDYTQVTLVGEPPGAARNAFGDAMTFEYPRTGLHLRVSTVRHQGLASTDLSEIIPVDVPARFSFADYAAGRDPAVDPILRGDEMRSIPVIAAADGGAVARATYAARKPAFGKYGWWASATEIQLRSAAAMLLAQKRVAAAVETAKLNAEIHPDVWNVWYNLGNALMAAGEREEALKSFRRVLEIDPTNFNGANLRAILNNPIPPSKP